MSTSKVGRLGTTITRRGFLGVLLCLPAVSKPDPLGLYFDLGKIKRLQATIPQMSWEGIPYHQSNATTGEWLGIRRE